MFPLCLSVYFIFFAFVVKHCHVAFENCSMSKDYYEFIRQKGNKKEKAGQTEGGGDNPAAALTGDGSISCDSCAALSSS